MASQRLSFGFEDFCKAAEVDLGMLDVSLFRIASPDPAISPEPGTKLSLNYKVSFRWGSDDLF